MRTKKELMYTVTRANMLTFLMSAQQTALVREEGEKRIKVIKELTEEQRKKIEERLKPK